MIESFSAQWFTAYYVTLGSVLITCGVYLILNKASVKEYLLRAAEDKKAPLLFRKSLKYLLLFTLPGLLLSFFPFSWIELIFTLWSLVIIYTAGQMLIQWPALSKQIVAASEKIPRKISFIGFNMISIGVVLFMLCYVLMSTRWG